MYECYTPKYWNVIQTILGEWRVLVSQGLWFESSEQSQKVDITEIYRGYFQLVTSLGDSHTNL